jgi:hypothetical protein
MGSPPLVEEVSGGGGQVIWGRCCWRMWPTRCGRLRYICALALTRLAADTSQMYL